MTPVIDPERIPEHLLHTDLRNTVETLRRRIVTLQRRLEDKQRENAELQRRLVWEEGENRRLRSGSEMSPRPGDRAHRVRTMLRDRASKNP
jgi:hypothetical protein